MYYVNENIKKTERIGEQQGRADYLRLDMNENPEGLPEEFVNKVLKQVTPEFLATYPEPEKLTKKIAEYHGINSDQVILTNGSDEAIKLIYQVFTKEGHNVVTVAPSFAMYGVYCNMFGVEHRIAEYDEKLQIHVESILHLMDQNTDLVVLLNPNNPIGNVYSEEEVKHVVQKAKETESLVIIDEAYHYFYPNSFMEIMKEEKNVLLLRTFSKLHAIAACRLGYALGDSQLITYLNRAKPTFHVNSFALLFGEAIIEELGLTEQMITIQREGKQYLDTRLKEMGYDTYVGEGNFVFISTKGESSYVRDELEKKYILVKTFGYALLRKYIRVTTGSTECMERFLETFKMIDQ